MNQNLQIKDTKNNAFTEARRARGLSQGSLATLAGFASIESIRRIENYGIIPKQLIRLRIAEILDVPETELWPAE